VSVSKEEVDKIALLAKLKLSEKEREKFTVQLSEILDYINKLNELDTEHVKPMYHILDFDTPLREDETKSTLSRERALMNAPAQEDGYFKTPKVKD